MELFQMCIQSVPESEYSGIVKEAIKIAYEAGEIMLKYFRAKSLESEVKSNSSDVVTEVDRNVETFVRKAIKDLYPAHGIISEESQPIPSKGDWYWVVDPLDGTTNFSQGLPVFNISIGIEKNGETVVGVVYAPYLREMFFAVKGCGAFFNGEQIHVSQKKNLETAVVATGLPYDKKDNPDNNLKEVACVAPEVRGLRRLGSAALDMAYVAAGFFDAYWELDLKQWDISAGMLLVREAGGDIFHLRRNRNYSILACAQTLASPLLEILLTPTIKS